MKWVGKVLGGAVGFLMGGPVGAMFGAAMGHQFDQNQQNDGPFRAEVESAEQYRVQMAFFTALFQAMGHLAKSDGRVNEMEIDMALRLMGRLKLSEEMRKNAMRLFNEGKRMDFKLTETLEKLRRECRYQLSLLRVFVEFQLELALADGLLNHTEERVLLQICEKLRFSRFEFHALRAAMEAQLRLANRGGWHGYRQQTAVKPKPPSLDECYASLGVKAAASDDEIRRAYRRLLSKHHPDKLAAAGASEEKIRLANEKTHEIRTAWEIIRNARQL